MDNIRAILQGLFGYVLYPIIVIGVFAFISIVIADFIFSVSGEKRIRRLFAAALPLTVIIFALAPLGGDSGGLEEILEFVSHWIRFVVGWLLGFITLAISRVLSRRDTELAAAIYVLFLSAIASFLIYCLVEGVLRNLHVFLLGLVLGGGLYVVFRGPPTRRSIADENEDAT